MANEVEPWLWQKAISAVHRYFKDMPAISGEVAKAHRTVEEGFYRTGWIMGYRAGMRSANNTGGQR